MLPYIKLLSKKLLENNIQSVTPDDSEEFFTQNTRFIDFHNRIGSDLCYIRIFNCSVANFQQYESSHKELFSHLKSQYESFNTPKIYILYLFIDEKINDEFSSLIENSPEFIGQEIYTINWGIEINRDIKETIFLNGKKQPSELGNIRKILNQVTSEYFNILDNSNHLPNTLSEIQEIVSRNDPFKKIVSIPFVTYFLLIFNGLILALTYMNGGPKDPQTLMEMGALVPKKIIEDGEYYRLFSSMFLHASLSHYASNALGIYIFGSRLEKYMGHAAFLSIYLVSGLGASIVGLIFIEYMAVGASGAIFGIMGAFLSFSLITKKSVDGLDIYFMILYCTLSIVGSLFMANIANSMHIGGFIVGMSLGFIFFKAKTHAKGELNE